MKSIKTAGQSVVSDYAHTKTLLYCYKYLGKYHYHLNQELKERVRFGYDAMHHLSTEKLLVSTIELNHRLAGIVNMKVLVDKGLANIPHIYANILVKKHIKAMEVNSIAKSLDISVRTFYRRYAQALKLIQEYFDLVGYSEDRLKDEYGEDTLYRKMYRYVVGTAHSS